MSKDCELGRVSKVLLMKGLFVNSVKLCSEDLSVLLVAQSNTVPSLNCIDICT